MELGPKRGLRVTSLVTYGKARLPAIGHDIEGRPLAENPPSRWVSGLRMAWRVVQLLVWAAVLAVVIATVALFGGWALDEHTQEGDGLTGPGLIMTAAGMLGIWLFMILRYVIGALWVPAHRLR